MEQKPSKEMPSKGSESITIIESATTPFRIVKKTTKDEQVFKIAIGDKIASVETFDSLDEAEKYIEIKPWELLINLIFITNEMLKNYENDNQEPTSKE